MAESVMKRTNYIWYLTGTTLSYGSASWNFDSRTSNSIVLGIEIQNSDGNWYSIAQGTSEMGVSTESLNLFISNSTDTSWRNRPCRAIMYYQ